MVKDLENQLSIHHNPSNNYFEVRYTLQQPQTAELCISDMSGRKISVVSVDYRKNSIRIDARNWANGVYLYRVQQGTKTIRYGKLVKQ